MAGWAVELLKNIRARRFYRDQIVHVERLRSQRAWHSELWRPLPRQLERAVRRAGVKQFYVHQAQAIDASVQLLDELAASAAETAQEAGASRIRFADTVEEPVAEALLAALVVSMAGLVVTLGWRPTVGRLDRSPELRSETPQSPPATAPPTALPEPRAPDRVAAAPSPQAERVEIEPDVVFIQGVARLVEVVRGAE